MANTWKDSKGKWKDKMFGEYDEYEKERSKSKNKNSRFKRPDWLHKRRD